MKGLYIEATKSSPAVAFDVEQHILMVKGQSYPENAFKFFEPILEWIEEYIQKGLTDNGETIVELNLPYINTSSSKCLMMLLELLEDAYNKGKNISVRWYYNEENESELECAEEFKEDLSLPFEIISYIES